MHPLNEKENARDVNWIESELYNFTVEGIFLYNWNEGVKITNKS